MELPKNYNPNEAEPRWQKFWEKEGVYKFDPEDTKREIYSIDTPPPTVSGKMHMGHAFGNSQQDFVARFKRMQGFNVLQPFGTDDNGLPTKLLIEKEKKIKANDMSRKEFVDICLKTLTEELRPRYIADWKILGISCDFDVFYTTINKHCRRISQRSFLDLYKQGRQYRAEAPAMFCPKCQTAISQVECEDKELNSYFNDIVFKVKNEKGKEEELMIATTRPELLPACVAVFYHPTDKRYQKLKGKKAKVPLFDFEVPILEDARADPEKGTGIVMCCTFGDSTDAEWQKAHNLPIKETIGKDGRMTKLAGKYEGEKIKDAREMIIIDMQEKDLLRDRKPITHSVNVHERCGTEIEFIHSKQWFVKYLDIKEDMYRWGEELKWYPTHMKNRYDNWVGGLQWDWCISRQLPFGIPFPTWYCKKCDEVILAKEENLPVDPVEDKPPVDKCPKCGCTEFIPEVDIINTWATSSLTPTIVKELFKGKPVYEKLVSAPMNLRPQGHDIITFWLFNTVIKSRLHYNMKPWNECFINGWMLDPKGKKMSKSKGNIIEPQVMIEKYCADALRFMAGSSKLGEDLPFPEKDLVSGKKTLTKIWNASKFAIMHLEDFELAKTEEKVKKGELELEVMDRWFLSELNKLIKECTDAFEEHEFSKSKHETDKFFWQKLCDNYLEIVKDRLYNPDVYGKDKREAAQYALYQGFSNVLRLFAPIMPHITEEVYSLYFSKVEGCKSIHVSKWPEVCKDWDDPGAVKIGEVVLKAVEDVRRAKSEKQVSLKTPVKKLIVKGKISKREFDEALIDLKGSTKAETVEYSELDKESEIDCETDIEI